MGVKLYAVLTTSFIVPTEATAVTPRKIRNKSEVTGTRPDSSIYDLISTQNLFHPSRSMINEKPAVEVSLPVETNDLPQLFGTIILDDKKLAILEDQATKKSSLYQVNNVVSGFIVSQILENKIILQKGSESIEVKLRSDKKFKQPRRTQARQRAIRKAPKQRKRASRVRRRRPQRRRSSVKRSGR